MGGVAFRFVCLSSPLPFLVLVRASRAVWDPLFRIWPFVRCAKVLGAPRLSGRPEERDSYRASIPSRGPGQADERAVKPQMVGAFAPPP
jgi:hypothetical protein